MVLTPPHFSSSNHAIDGSCSLPVNDRSLHRHTNLQIVQRSLLGFLDELMKQDHPATNQRPDSPAALLEEILSSLWNL